jgi:hypothetical protein
MPKLDPSSDEFSAAGHLDSSFSRVASSVVV